MDRASLLNKVEQFVEESFEQKLAGTMSFHNYEHTLLVVEGVKIIGKDNHISDEDYFILVIAALLHDIGYTEKYIGHELVSANIASTFLSNNGLDEANIQIIRDCILATRYPQYPKTELEKIICDADFYHFSFDNYQDYANKLKREWEIHLHKIYSNQDWDKVNFQMLSKHEYFTVYGKTILQPKKQRNINKLSGYIG